MFTQKENDQSLNLSRLIRKAEEREEYVKKRVRENQKNIKEIISKNKYTEKEQIQFVLYYRMLEGEYALFNRYSDFYKNDPVTFSIYKESLCFLENINEMIADALCIAKGELTIEDYAVSAEKFLEIFLNKVIFEDIYQKNYLKLRNEFLENFHELKNKIGEFYECKESIININEYEYIINYYSDICLSLKKSIERSSDLYKEVYGNIPRKKIDALLHDTGTNIAPFEGNEEKKEFFFDIVKVILNKIELANKNNIFSIENGKDINRDIEKLINFHKKYNNKLKNEEYLMINIENKSYDAQKFLEEVQQIILPVEFERIYVDDYFSLEKEIDNLLLYLREWTRLFCERREKYEANRGNGTLKTEYEDANHNLESALFKTEKLWNRMYRKKFSDSLEALSKKVIDNDVELKKEEKQSTFLKKLEETRQQLEIPLKIGEMATKYFKYIGPGFTYILSKLMF